MNLQKPLISMSRSRAVRERARAMLEKQKRRERKKKRVEKLPGKGAPWKDRGHTHVSKERENEQTRTMTTEWNDANFPTTNRIRQWQRHAFAYCPARRDSENRHIHDRPGGSAVSEPPNATKRPNTCNLKPTTTLVSADKKGCRCGTRLPSAYE